MSSVMIWELMCLDRCDKITEDEDDDDDVWSREEIRLIDSFKRSRHWIRLLCSWAQCMDAWGISDRIYLKWYCWEIISSIYSVSYHMQYYLSPGKSDICLKAFGLFHRTLMEEHEMRWSLSFYAVKSEQKPGKRKNTVLFMQLFSCNDKCSVAFFFCRSTLFVFHCLQNQINELQWSISSAKSTSCRFWWESNLFFAKLMIHAFCVHFFRSCF